MTVSYVGSRGHNILVVQPTNPGNPGALPERQPSEPGGAGQRRPAVRSPKTASFTTADGTVINGTRPVCVRTSAPSPRRQRSDIRGTTRSSWTSGTTARQGGVLLGYTYSKSMDTSSNLGEQINPFDPDATVGAVGVRPAAQLHCQLQLRPAVRRESSGAERADHRLDDFRDHPVQQRISGHALQRHRHVAARHLRQRRQQPPARHAGLHARLRSATQPRSYEGRRIQHGLFQPAAAWPAWHRPAPVLLRTRHREHGPDADQDVPLRRSSAAAPRWRHSTSSITRSSTGRALSTATSSAQHSANRAAPRRRG